VFTPGEEQFCTTVIFKLGSPNKQINQLNDEAKSKHKSKQASKQPTNQHGVILENVVVTQPRNFPYIIEPEGSLLCSQQPTTSIYVGHMHPVTFQPHSLKIHFDTILPSVPKSPKIIFLQIFPPKFVHFLPHTSHDPLSVLLTLT